MVGSLMIPQPSVSLAMEHSQSALKKSRIEKFHKLFKLVPQNEDPIDYFSCAYIGDILLQGYLYISHNWVCFYSRIRGRGRLLEIPMCDIISITREKTAIIFPNAIGIQTKTNKFAFGSFMSRDSTYKFINGYWKISQESKMGSLFEDIQDPSGNLYSAVSSSHSYSNSTDQSDSSVCEDIVSHDICNISVSHIDNTDSISSPIHQHMCSDNLHVANKIGIERKLNQSRRIGVQFPYSLMNCINREKTFEALRKSVIKLQQIPRTNFLLAICTCLVLFLLLSAVGLTYKILDLENKIARHVWEHADQQNLKYKAYHELYNVQVDESETEAQHFRNILKNNIRILDEIKNNLKTLETYHIKNETEIKPAKEL